MKWFKGSIKNIKLIILITYGTLAYTSEFSSDYDVLTTEAKTIQKSSEMKKNKRSDLENVCGDSVDKSGLTSSVSVSYIKDERNIQSVNDVFIDQLNILTITSLVKDKINSIFFNTAKQGISFIIETPDESNTINDGAAYVLGMALIENKTLHSLDITGNRLTDKNMSIVVEALRKNTIIPLRFLYLGYNEIKNSGALIIAEFLKQNTLLEVLDLSNNAIEESGIITLAEALTQNTTLRILDLRQNSADVFSLIEQGIVNKFLLTKMLFFSRKNKFKGRSDNWPLKLIIETSSGVRIQDGFVHMENEHTHMAHYRLLNHGHQHTVKFCSIS